MRDSENRVALSAEQSREIEASTCAHTPGPLQARQINSDPRPYAVINPHGPHGDEIVAGYLSKADAELFAAAPELLAVLKAVLEGKGHMLAPQVIHDARAAIAKAEGR